MLLLAIISLWALLLPLLRNKSDGVLDIASCIHLSRHHVEPPMMFGMHGVIWLHIPECFISLLREVVLDNDDP